MLQCHPPRQCCPPPSFNQQKIDKVAKLTRLPGQFLWQTNKQGGLIESDGKINSSIHSLTSTYIGGQGHGWWGDGQPRTLDQTFFHEQKKGGNINYFVQKPNQISYFNSVNHVNSAQGAVCTVRQPCGQNSQNSLVYATVLYYIAHEVDTGP